METKNGEVIFSPLTKTKRVDINNFRGLPDMRFDDRSIEIDQKKVSERRQLYENNGSKNSFGNKGGDALESVFERYGNHSEWFAKKSVLTRASEYEDYFNGTDFYLEFDGQNQKNVEDRVVLAIDVTSTIENGRLIGKVDSAVTKVTTHNGGDIKYFESGVDEFKGYLKGTIPVTVGVDSNHTLDLMLHDSDIKNHPYQMVFLEEIKLQFDYYLLLEISAEMKSKIEVAKSKIERILEEKKNITEKTRTDVTSSQLNNYLETKIKERKKYLEPKKEERRGVARVISIPYGVRELKALMRK